MVRIATQIKSLVPALIFFLIAAFLLSRMMIGFSPDSEFAWRLYFLFAPFGREVGTLVDTAPSWGNFSFIACLVFFGLAAFNASSRADWFRTRFLMTHASLLVTLFALNDERVFAAAISPALQYGEANGWPELTTAHPVLIALLVALLGLCLHSHWNVISNFARRK